MVDAVKNYGLSGVDSTVELGKGGNKIDGTTSSSKVSLRNTGGTLIKAEIGAGTASTHAVTLTQLDSAQDEKVGISKHTVAYNDSGAQNLCIVAAGTRVLSVTVTKGAGNWTGANSTTEIIVGDAGDTDRLFSGFEPAGGQFVDETDHLYASATQLTATVTRGGASAGTAIILIRYAGSVS